MLGGFLLCYNQGMGRRYWNNRAPEYVSFSECWPGVGTGRYWKRKLSKARRKYHKMVIRYGRGREPTWLESEVNWKTW